ncbi:hypothetical protein ACO0QE_004137 [Hanseniaspora vineae]
MFRLFRDKKNGSGSTSSLGSVANDSNGSTTNSSATSMHSVRSNRSGSSLATTGTSSTNKKAYTKQEQETELVLNQAECFEIALQAMDYLLDDHAEKGYTILSEKTQQVALNQKHYPPGSEMILTLATGVIQFLEATLGFEASMINKARETMSKAEDQATKAQNYNIKKNLVTSSYYPPGTEFKVTYTESCLLNALLMLFNESMMDSAKALYKLRKAYNNLQDLEKLITKAKIMQKRDNDLKGKANLTESANTTTTTTTTSTTNNNHNNNNNDDIKSMASSAASFRTANDEDESDSSNTQENNSFKGKTNPSQQSLSSLYSDVPYDLQKTDSSPNLIKLAEKVHDMRDQRLKGSHIGNTPASNRLRTQLGLQSTIKKNTANTTTTKGNETQQFMYLNGDSSNSKPTVDEFIESGCDLCFGIIQVVLSLIPPAIGGVLSIIGFRGNREDGLRLIWRCVQERNIHGGLGLCGLLFYYNGPFQFVDDDFDIPATTNSVSSLQQSMSSASISSGSSSSLGAKTGSANREMTSHELLHPGKKLHDELLKARAVFPNSALWILQEGAVLAGNGKLDEALEVMDSIDLNLIEMKQVKTQLVFNRAIMLVYLQKYERAAEDFLYLLEINDWSHAFYTYFAGCCYLENYRMCQMGVSTDGLDMSKMDFYREKATTLIYKAPSYLNTKKFMAKNLPFDRFMNRKVTMFQNIAKKYNIKDPLDCIPISPVNELTYLYDGYTRMYEKNLLNSLKMVIEYKNPAIDLQLEDQETIKEFLTAVIYRRVGKVSEGCEILDQKIIPKIIQSENNGKVKFYKLKDDPWLYPSALYERALFNWKLEDVKGLKDCRDWLQKSLDFAGDYELSSRIGMKTKAALSRVQDEI